MNTRLYRPSNGFEGMDFIAAFCFHCRHDAKFRQTQHGEDGCPILSATFLYEREDPRYPHEWSYGEDGLPRCTAFEPEHTK